MEEINNQTPPKKTNIRSIIFLTVIITVFSVIIIALIIGIGVYFGAKSYVQNKTIEQVLEGGEQNNKTSQTNTPSATNSAIGNAKEQPKLSDSETVSVDQVWNKYTNNKLGFSIKVPKETQTFYGSCDYSNANGDHSYRPKPSSVPTTVLEDGNDVYVTVNYFYKLGGETKDNGKSYFSTCDKTDTTLSILQLEQANAHVPSRWKFLVRPATNDAAITAFIQSHYGSGCSLREKKPTAQDGVFEILMEGDGLDLEQTKCPLNYVTKLMYSPQKGKLVSWDMGQAYTFYKDDNIQYDADMTESFRFE